jgi:ParB-like chromosome segregation protein Spo0J
MPVPSAEDFEHANYLVREAYKLLGFEHPQPVGCVQWVPHAQVQANDYNPNSVAHQEMKLLHTSIEADGYTQPVVVIWDPDLEKYIVIDGFHRYTALAMYGDLNSRTGGYLPVVILEKSLAERMASTVRHNRARGKHSVNGMGNLVFSMLKEGRTPEEVCAELGLEAEELARLTHITGYSKLFGDVSFSAPMLTTAQVKAKARYKREHPEETVPNDF